ncbi:MAG TPA: hypothetical protein VFU12_07440 [Glycomyces sp.]|nr:hypothetical protein [Glycomyces sp.]
MGSPERALSDIDEYVTLRTDAHGAVTVELSAAGFRRPPAEIARLIVETAERLPAPAADARETMEAGIEAVGRLHRAMDTGGYEAFADMMRTRLGIEAPPNTLTGDAEHEQALAAHLGGVLNTMREAAAPRQEEPPAALTAEAATAEGDIAVVTSTERVIAEVRLDKVARGRGIEGLGEALTALLAKARDELRERSAAQAREGLADEAAAAIDGAPDDGDRAGRAGAAIMDEVVRASATARRKAGME